MYLVCKCWNYVRKEYRIFNLCFAIFTSFLLIDELKLYFIYKPTFTSIVQTQLKPEHFPNILICPYPSYDLEELQSIGYDHSYDYSSGLSEEGILIGWRGNNSQDTIADITHNLSVIRTLQDCPQIKAKFEQNGIMVKKELSRQLSRAVYPNGRCCRVLTPDIAKSNIVHRLYFRIYVNKYKNQNVNGFKMILSEPRSSSIFRQHEFSVDGDRLIAPRKVVGYQEYKVKIKEEFHLRDDPNFICDNYNNVGQYDRCLEQEFVRQSLEILNCTPPWMTDNQSLWCRHAINVEEEISKKANFLFEHVIYGKAEDGKCKSSCKKTRYAIEKIGFYATKKKSGLGITFDNLVEQTISELQIGPKTLLVRFGGIIGVGKNLLWIIIFSVSSFMGFWSFLNSKIRFNTKIGRK